MIGLAFQLVWALARLLLCFSWLTGTLIGYAVVLIVRGYTTTRRLPPSALPRKVRK